MERLDLQRCTGCRACEQVCPKKCINMVPDKNGFLYPQIDESKCVGCNLCAKLCPNNSNFKNDTKSQKCFAAYINSPEDLAHSSSGGVFTAIAKMVLNRGGMVFGCAFNTDCEAHHICIETLKNLNQLRGSKYVQSDTADTFLKTKKILEDGIPVLYTGTPCQIAGLKSFLKKDYDNLLTADLICHGVPSAAIFSNYIKWLEKRISGKVINYRFRDKQYGWGHTGSIIYLNDYTLKHKKIIAALDPYYSLFLKGILYRDCCYECAYACRQRTGDFTLGDFWGAEKYYPELPVRNGLSILLVNTEKAARNLGCLSKDLSLMPIPFSRLAENNGQLESPAEKSELRELFLSAAQSDDFNDVAKLWRRKFKKSIIKAAIKTKFPFILK